MGLLTPLHADGLLDAIGVLLDEIRPDVVSLTDAFGFDDYNLKVRVVWGGEGCALYATNTNGIQRRRHRDRQAYALE